MLWHTEMACGVHLGILLICLVQAEHVRCLWATQAQSSQRQKANKNVGFSQQDSGPGRLGGSYPQNQLRQASAQSSSFKPQTAGSSAYSKRLSNSGYTQTLSQPAQKSSVSVRLVQSSSLSKPNWRVSKMSRVSAPKEPKRQFFGLSTDIASGSSVSKYNRKQNLLTDVSKKRTWPVQQGTPRASKSASSSSASVQTPAGRSKSASHQSAAQKAPSSAGQTGYSPVKSSSLFSGGAAVPQESPVRMQTSASAPARRVMKTPKPPHFSPQNEKTRNNPSQTEVGNPHQSKLFQGSSKPTSTSSGASNYASYSQSLPASNKQNAPASFQPQSQKMPTSQRSSYNPSYTATDLSSSTSSLQASWNSRNLAQGARNLPASGSSRVGTSGPRYAPTRVYNIPQRFGGFAIRRLKEPDDEKKVSVQKPQQPYTPSRQAYPAPSRQPYTPSRQAYPAPSRQPYTPSRQAYQAPSRQPYTAPPQQSTSFKPQAQSVHRQSKWKRVRPGKGH